MASVSGPSVLGGFRLEKLVTPERLEKYRVPERLAAEEPSLRSILDLTDPSNKAASWKALGEVLSDVTDEPQVIPDPELVATRGASDEPVSGKTQSLSHLKIRRVSKMERQEPEQAAEDSSRFALEAPHRDIGPVDSRGGAEPPAGYGQQFYQPTSFSGPAILQTQPEPPRVPAVSSDPTVAGTSSLHGASLLFRIRDGREDPDPFCAFIARATPDEARKLAQELAPSVNDMLNTGACTLVVLELLKREDNVISDIIASQMSGWYARHALNENASRVVRSILKDANVSSAYRISARQEIIQNISLLWNIPDSTRQVKIAIFRSSYDELLGIFDQLVRVLSQEDMAQVLHSELRRETLAAAFTRLNDLQQEDPSRLAVQSASLDWLRHSILGDAEMLRETRNGLYLMRRVVAVTPARFLPPVLEMLRGRVVYFACNGAERKALLEEVIHACDAEQRELIRHEVLGNNRNNEERLRVMLEDNMAVYTVRALLTAGRSDPNHEQFRRRCSELLPYTKIGNLERKHLMPYL